MTGPVSTGPFFVRTGQNNAINVKVQNTSNTPIDARVILIGLECPANNPLQAVTLTNIPGGCCADDAVVTAGAGNFEVVVCPDPADAPIRVFVSVHSGNAPTSNIEYVIRGRRCSPLCAAPALDRPSARPGSWAAPRRWLRAPQPRARFICVQCSPYPAT